MSDRANGTKHEKNASKRKEIEIIIVILVIVGIVGVGLYVGYQLFVIVIFNLICRIFEGLWILVKGIGELMEVTK